MMALEFNTAGKTSLDLTFAQTTQTQINAHAC